MSELPEAIRRAVEGEELPEALAAAALTRIMAGEATQAQIGALLVALRCKGETAGEIAAFARVMRAHATRVEAPADAIDVVGTGGDSLKTFNISTCAALVAAGAGARVAKHGNRAVSSSSGAADALQALGVDIEAAPDAVARCIAGAGVGFLFAPRLHPAMKHVAGPRRELGIRTVFNLLGPLTNPAGARRQLLGVYAAPLVPVLADVLLRLGAERAWVVHGVGMDEIALCGETRVAELRDGRIREFSVAPEDAGLPRAPVEALKAADAAESAARIREVLDGKPGPARDVVLLNAGAALIVAGKADDLRRGAALAAAAIDDGRARAALEALVRLSRGAA